ncbi:MAG: hypothetical protein CM15mP32_0280 [Flavobacteriaceae bacterium]|nr:MAG: hypothetical protein CM15mP32_0280 [Flavobacteriaceae bacterium]
MLYPLFLNQFPKKDFGVEEIDQLSKKTFKGEGIGRKLGVVSCFR